MSVKLRSQFFTSLRTFAFTFCNGNYFFIDRVTHFSIRLCNSNKSSTPDKIRKLHQSYCISYLSRIKPSDRMPRLNPAVSHRGGDLPRPSFAKGDAFSPSARRTQEREKAPPSIFVEQSAAIHFRSRMRIQCKSYAGS